MMKKSTKNFLRKVKFLPLFLILFTTACAQPTGEVKLQTNVSNESKSMVEVPKTNIQMAIMTGNLEVVKQHIEAGTDINAKDQLSGSSPLISAITFGKNEIAKVLIDANADLTLGNNEGSTPLHVAAFFCRIEIVQMLIDAKADKALKNNYGATARESVIAPFSDMKPIYEMMQQQLGGLGVKIDLEEVKKSRPVVAMMLQ